MKDVQDTSKEAYLQILPHIGHKQQVIYEQLQQFPLSPTVAEIANSLSVDTRDVAPRVNELMHLNRIVNNGKRKCAVTGKTVFTWKKT